VVVAFDQSDCSVSAGNQRCRFGGDYQRRWAVCCNADETVGFAWVLGTLLLVDVNSREGGGKYRQHEAQHRRVTPYVECWIGNCHPHTPE